MEQGSGMVGVNHVGQCRKAAVGSVGLVVALPVRELTPAEREKRAKEIGGLDKEIDALTKKLGNVAFLSRAPEDVVAKSKKQLAELEERRRRLAGNLGA